MRPRLIALVSAAWLLPLVRAARLWVHCLREDTGSTNTAEDIRFAQTLLVSYGLSLVVAVVLVWFLPGRRPGLRILPPVASLLLAAYVVWLAPEGVVIFLPTMPPFLPAVLSLMMGGAAVLIAFLDPDGYRPSTIPSGTPDPARPPPNPPCRIDPIP